MRYRDTKTGRLVSKQTWKRSRAQGGTRYKRERPKPKEEEPIEEPEELPEPEDFGFEGEEEVEYEGAFDSP